MLLRMGARMAAALCASEREPSIHSEKANPSEKARCAHCEMVPAMAMRGHHTEFSLRFCMVYEVYDTRNASGQAC